MEVAKVSRKRTQIWYRIGSKTGCAKWLCNRFVMAFIFGMVFLEVVATLVDIEWPEDLDMDESLVYPVDIEKKYDHMYVDPGAGFDQKELDLNEPITKLTADDVIEIQNGGLENGDRKLLHYIKSQVFWPSSLPLNLSDQSKYDYSQSGQSGFVDTLLKSKRDGFYVECGAGDGEYMSDTLYFERQRNWTGLLVEPHPGVFSELLMKHRKALTLHACVSPTLTASLRTLRATKNFLSGLKGEVDELHQGTNFQTYPFYQADIPVQCYSLPSILDALEVSEIDYLSLDVEGSETGILRTIPFDRLHIDVISVDFRAQGPKYDHQDRSLAKLKDIRDVMEATGLYIEAGLLLDQPELRAVSDKTFREKFATDIVFLRKDLAEDSVRKMAS
ncbi:hypothetical protein CAPTEDRAFT_195179 [Capitella teleta]|uniref:Methyltransferase FkbM domain-containing protein n=1 Tax=Capitella teleta TaxID=283909 RepID=R7U5V1_CAPTE|nr:hypothetical protein CAPTEDRAFT_195179 [Capitella teleta]|eukprot:ELU01750.1 hypothetical protein CAPTEDRAFT_195179 [Capitella teleta]